MSFFNVPHYVRRLLEGDHLERAETEAQRLGVRLREAPSTRWPRSMREERSAVEQMLSAAASDPAKLTEVVEHLRQLTITGTNDLQLPELAAPWLSLIARLLRIDPKLAALAGRRWYAAIIEVSLDMEEGGLANRPFTANLAGVLSAHASEDVKAEHHLMGGQVEAEGADEDETGPFLCAVRWARDAIRVGIGPGRALD